MPWRLAEGNERADPRDDHVYPPALPLKPCLLIQIMDCWAISQSTSFEVMAESSEFSSRRITFGSPDSRSSIFMRRLRMAMAHDRR